MTRRLASALAGLLVFLIAAPARAQSMMIPPGDSIWRLNGEWKYHAGDSAQWARPDYVDSAWKSARLSHFRGKDLVPRFGFVWFRTPVNIPAGLKAEAGFSIRHTPETAQEFYWDGELVGKTGVVGATLETEALGNNWMTDVPARLATPGRHLLAIRISSQHHSSFPSNLMISVGEGEALERDTLALCMVMMFLSGIFIFGAGYRMLSYRAAGYGRNATLFALFTLSCALYVILQFCEFFITIGPGWSMAMRIMLGVAWYFMMSLVPDYFVFAAIFPYKRIVPIMMVAGLFFAVPMTFLFTGLLPTRWWMPVYMANQAFTYFSISLSIWVVAWAIWRKQIGSIPALIGLVCLFIGVFASWVLEVEWGWAAGVAAHIILLARAQSLQISARMKAHKESQLRSARLEIELLKKNIQPHFLLNSLNSIIAWLEEEPKMAVRLVNALADELEMLLKISSERTIPLEEEIRLCRAHLQVMGLRQDKSYQLVFAGPADGEHLPPMVLHTLVENGLTHGYAGRSQGLFVLTRSEVPGGVRFSLFNDGTPKTKAGKTGEGTGLRYIRTRLEEAFPGKWALESGPVENGWQVNLDVRR